MSTSTGAERTILRNGDHELDRLLDDLLGFGGVRRRRPVIVENTVRHLVWVDEDDCNEDLEDDADLTDGAVVLDGRIRVADPDGEMGWWHVYPREIGPENAPVQGPVWECAERGCRGYQPAGAGWLRFHSPMCPTLALVGDW
ncbi:hypothetical protein [Frankia sp. AvcI1]|uniref:hypothetical protein n=1 Tax=Frankia sp. AvcI1 TaxID=573496 RepID=UPI0021177440|nr:hypothetical protein [Frankia sp. AvcI1]